MSEDKDMDRVERANEANSILRSRAWAEAWEAIDGALVDKWRGTRSEEERTELWRYVQITGKLKQYFESVINEGAIAAQQLAVLRKGETFMERLQERIRRKV